jgi:hypothetical protein
MAAATPQSKAQKAYEKRAEEELAEYSTYVATADISFNGVPAYRAGHPVPVSNVRKFRYDEQGLVKKVRGEERTQAQQAHAANSDAEK